MLGLIESLVAIFAIIITCRFAGRIPAMMVTAVAAASAAIIMPPFASWEVESTTDLLALVFQTIIGLAVAYKWPPKNEAVHKKSSATQLRREGAPAVSQDQLEQILSDVMQLASADCKTQRIKVHTSRRPSVDQISVVAEYDSSVPLPRLRILGRSDSQCAIRMKGWPANCSVASFDNGFEKTYIISIREIPGNSWTDTEFLKPKKFGVCPRISRYTSPPERN